VASVLPSATVGEVKSVTKRGERKQEQSAQEHDEPTHWFHAGSQRSADPLSAPSILSGRSREESDERGRECPCSFTPQQGPRPCLLPPSSRAGFLLTRRELPAKQAFLTRLAVEEGRDGTARLEIMPSMSTVLPSVKNLMAFSSVISFLHSSFGSLPLQVLGSLAAMSRCSRSACRRSDLCRLSAQTGQAAMGVAVWRKSKGGPESGSFSPCGKTKAGLQVILDLDGGSEAPRPCGCGSPSSGPMKRFSISASLLHP